MATNEVSGVGQSARNLAATGAAWGACRPGTTGRLCLALSRHTPLGRGGARRLLARVFHGLHKGAVDTTIAGVPVRLHPERNVSERTALFRPDRLGGGVMHELRAAVSHAGAVFVDVGANAGLFSLDLARHGGEGLRILAIDPDPSLLDRLTYNLALARAHGAVAPGVQVETADVAISDHDGLGQFAVEGSEGGRHLLGDGETTGGPASRSVPLRTLAGLLAERGISVVDLMKIDVEGHEDKVLPPYLDTVPADRWPRRILIEHVHRQAWTRDPIAECERRGYRIRFRTNNDTFLERAP